jgi:hypothetical protein
MVIVLRILALLLVSPFFIFALSVQAQVTGKVAIAPRAGTVQDEFIMTVTIEGARLSSPIVGKSNDWQVQRVGTETRVNTINGSLSVVVVHRFALTPLREGKLESPPVTVAFEGKAIELPHDSVDVSAATQATGSAQDGALTINQSLSKERVYKGEQTTHTVEIITRVELAEPRISDTPVDAVWSTPIGQEEHFTRMLQGVPHTVIHLRKALFPLSSGTLDIPERTLTAKIPDGSSMQDLGFPNMMPHGLLDRFLGAASYKKISLVAPKLSLFVQELPPIPASLQRQGAPAPLIGQSQLELKGDTSDVRVGDTKLFTLELTSLANVNAIKEAPQAPSSSYKVYPGTPSLKEFENNNQLVFKKSFPLSIVPLVPGDITIPALSLTYFDPELGVYKLATTRPTTFKAYGSALSNTTAQEVLPEATTTPTIPPPTATPPPRYEELSLLDTYIERFSYSHLLFALFIVICFIGVLLLYYRLQAQATKLHRSKQRQAVLTTPQAVFDALTERLTQHYGIKPKTFAEVRVILMNRLTQEDEKFALLSALDELEHLVDGSTATHAEQLQKVARTLLSSSLH